MIESQIATVTTGVIGIGSGVCGAFVTHFLSRQKSRAEIEESAARTAESRARTTKLLTDMSVSDKADLPRSRRLPHGWRERGDDVPAYEMGADDSGRFGARCAYLKSRQQTTGFGTLMQTVRADLYRGKRLRLSGRMKARDVDGWAGLWMRIDGPKGEPLGFDNMQDRPMTGTTELMKCHVVLDVPEEAVFVAFGILLAGEGQVWGSEMHLEIVGVGIPTTIAEPEDFPLEPVNLDFSK
jgi:hypothetical protein